MTRAKSNKARQTKIDTFLSSPASAKTASSSKHTNGAERASGSKKKSAGIKGYFQPQAPGQTRKQAGRPVAVNHQNSEHESEREEGPPSHDPSDVEEIHFEPRRKRQVVELSDEESSDSSSSSLPDDPQQDVPPPTRKARHNLFGSPIKVSTQKRKMMASSPVSSRAPSPSEEPEPLRMRPDKGKKRYVVESEEEDEDEESPPKKRRMTLKHFDQEAADIREAQEELEEELDPEVIIDSKLRKKRNTKMSAFQKNLERLKRRRAGQSEPEEEEEEEEEEPAPKPFKGARPGIIELDSDSDEVSEPREPDQEEDDAFIIEDDEDPADADLPPEYSMHSYQDASHHFKVVCQLFTHLIVSAGDDRRARERLLDTNYFKIALNALRRSVGSTRESLVASSVWRPDFRKTLETCPELYLEHMSDSWPGCDACHFSSRISTIEAHIKGKKWGGLLTPDRVESGSDSDDDDDDRERETVWRVGRVCASRLKLYHEFSHWEHVLYDAIQDQVDLLHHTGSGTGHRPKRMFVHADAPDNVNDADAIMDWLDRKAVIATEWSRFQRMLESAQNINNMKPEDDIVG